MSKKVLIIDDEIHIIKIIKYKLKQEGYKVSYALNGADGIKMAKSEKPDIILLDIMMPVMNGFAVFRTLKEDRETKNIPVVMVTAKSQDVDRQKAEKMGVADYIIKPFSPQTICETVKSIID